MAIRTTKGYNKETEQYEVIASTDAKVIESRNDTLIQYLGKEEEEEPAVNVEEVLEKVAEDMKTAQGNIAWLALHGGGGSGGGGGGGGQVASGEIKVNGNITTNPSNPIIRKDSDRLYFIVEQSIVQSWDYLVTFNGITIKTGTVTSNQITIADAANPLNYVNGQGTLNITCTSGLSAIYWTGTIIKNQLSLTVDAPTVSIEDINTAQIVYTFSSTTVGDYTLTVNGIAHNVRVDQVNREYTEIFMVNELYTSANVGSNTTNAVLQYNNDSSVVTAISHQVVIISNTIVISSPSLVAGGITEVPKNNNIPCLFTAYLSSEATMYYDIILDGNTIIDNAVGRFNVAIQQYIPTNNPSFIIGNTYELRINVRSSNGLSASEIYQVLITQSSTITLSIPKKEDLLTDLNAFASAGAGNNWVSHNPDYILSGTTPVVSSQAVVLHNPNILSGIKTSESDPTYYRLSNKAYGVLTNWDIDGSAYDFQRILNVKRSFTINLCFKADYHSEDNRTIFQLGSLNDDYSLASGILVRVHDIQVKGTGPTLKVELQDKEIYNIDIVYDPSNRGTVKVYVNGVVTKVNENMGTLDFTGCTPYIGCSYRLTSGVDEIVNYSDVNFYRMMFYTTILNDYDILINHLQNMAYTHFVDGRPDNSQITEGMNRNFLVMNAQGEIETSWLWNPTLNDYSLDNFISTQYNPSTGKIICSINPNIVNYNLPIPLLFLDLSSSSNWTWERFRGPDVLDAAQNIPFNYYDSKGSNTSIISGSCSIEMQGTSTLSNNIKNLKITFRTPDGQNVNIFVPKTNWCPEASYTLKADIVDSSHSLNAAIGKFVNDTLASSENSGRWFPLHAGSLAKFKASSYYRACSDDAKPTMKAAVEGFPFFLIMRFYTADTTAVDIEGLGIYQFILGRDSVHNLGLKILESVNDGTGNAIVPDSFPFYREGCTFTEGNEQSYWIEAGSTRNVQQGVDLGGDPQALQTSNGLTALCWHNTEGVLNNQFEVKYGGGLPFNVPGFRELIGSIAQAPTCLYTYYDSGIGATQQQLFTTYYPELDTTNGTDYFPTGNQVIIQNSDDNIVINDYLDLETAYKYWVVAMALGLADNFCKNEPFILFDYDPYDEVGANPFRMTFYDMDTGAGGDNNGTISTEPYLFAKSLANENTFVKETYNKGSNDIITGADNKLWLVLEAPRVAGKLSIPNTDNAYTYFWNDFRTTCYNIYSNLVKEDGSRYTDFTDYFVNGFFIPQTEGCGELLFNLTYQMKYLTTAQSSYLAGRRIQQVTQWLREHIDFMDSVAGWKTAPSRLMNASDNNDTVARIYSRDTYATIPLKYNESLVIRTTDQGGTYTFPTFCKKNTYTNVHYGRGEDSVPISKTVSWSNKLLEIGNSEQLFGNSGFSRMDASTLWGFNTLDLSNCSSLSGVSGTSPIAFESTFYQPGYGSELRVINLENATNVSNEPNMVLDLSNFTKITDINIRNSSVGSIALPSTPLVSLDITGSLLGTLNLISQNLLDEIDVTGCSKLTSLYVSDCQRISEVRGLNGLGNLTSVNINNCNLTSLVISSCSSLVSISLDEENLESLEITNCSSLTSLNLAGCKNLRSLKVNDCTALTSITFSPITLGDTWMENLESLDISRTNVKSVRFGTVEDTSILNLPVFTALNDFQCSGDPEVEYIRFANNPNRAIPLTHSFYGCDKLTRIYGHVVVTNDYVSGRGSFAGCSQFSIHGSSFHGQSVLNGSVFRMPQEILGFTLTLTAPTKAAYLERIFYDNDTATNMDFAGSNAHYMFSGTSCTQFDVYYFFSNLGTITSCSRTFNGLTNTIFNWTASYDNSPNRWMFKYCDNLISLDHPFYGSCGYYRIFSPEHTSESHIENGLFSPLTRLTSLGWAGQGSYLADNFVFQRWLGNYALTSISYFYPRLLVEDVNTMSYVNVNDQSSLANYLLQNDNYLKVGNLSGMFANTPSLTAIHAFLAGTMFINFDLSYSNGEEHFKFPDGITTLKDVCRPQYATGEIRFPEYFNSTSNLANIHHSFRVTNEVPSQLLSVIGNPTMTLNADTFSKFGTKLKHISYDPSGDNAGSVLSPSFSGAVRKTVERTSDGGFPYNMFNANTGLTEVVGLFMNATMSDNNNSVALPGSLFNFPANVSTNAIQDLSALFYNFNNPYTLTADGFAKCTNLKKVAYMFGQDYNRTTFNLTGAIPARLFYHGSVNTSKDIWGTDTRTGPDASGEYTYGTPEKTVVHYTKYNANIEDISYVFQRTNLDPYVNASPTAENNENYVPYRYQYTNYTMSGGVPVGGTWSETDYDNNRCLQTAIWNYDGVHTYDATTYEFLDEVHDASGAVPIYNPQNISDFEPGSLYFCCPPDLFRYCKPNANVAGTFAYSGTLYHTPQYEAGGYSFRDFGLKGRICPYLLKPVNATTSIANMFRQCKMLASYYEDDTKAKSRKIPVTFFSYAPKITNLSYAFSGLIFDAAIDLTVFQSVDNLDINHIFWGPFWERSTVSSLFLGKAITNARHAFSLVASDGDVASDQTPLTRAQNVTFSSMFTKSRVASNLIGNLYTDSYVFAGYRNSTVQFVGTKTLDTVSYKYNYATV